MMNEHEDDEYFYEEFLKEQGYLMSEREWMERTLYLRNIKEHNKDVQKQTNRINEDTQSGLTRTTEISE